MPLHCFFCIWPFVVHRRCWQRNENGTLNRQGKKDFWGGEACPARWPMRSNPVGQAELACDCRWGIENACYSQTGKALKNMAWRKGRVSLVKLKKTI